MVKFKTPEEATEALKAAKEELEVAKTEFKTFRGEKKIKKDATADDIEDVKVKARFEKMSAQVDKKRKAVEEIKEWQKTNKPKKADRPAKYDYKPGMTSLEKKKFRAAERARLKREAKEKDPAYKAKQEEKKKKADKKGKEAPAETKKDKKKKAKSKDKETKAEETSEGAATEEAGAPESED